MKVFLAFYAGSENPYIDLLSDALTEAGVDVRLVPPCLISPLFRGVWQHGLPDIVHIQWPIYFTTQQTILHLFFRTTQFFLQFFFLRLVGVRFVWTIHNLVNHEKRYVAWELRASRFFARQVDRLIVHCRHVLPLVADSYQVPAAHLSVIPIGEYADWYPSTIDKRRARAQMDLDEDATLFLFFGLIREYKNIEGLLDSFAEVGEPSARLLVVGKPATQALANNLIATAAHDSRVAMRFEYVDKTTLVAYISACDIVVLPYADALTSSAAIMAASLGRAALVSTAGCMQELPESGFIRFSLSQEGALTLAMRRALTSDLDVMGESARQYATQFPWSLVARETVDLYESVCS